MDNQIFSIMETMFGLNGAMLMGALYVVFALGILLIVAHWKMFTKAGEPGWKAVIPIYSDYTLTRLVWSSKGFWIFAGLVAATFVTNMLSGQFMVGADGQLVLGATNGFFGILATISSIAMIICSFVISAKTAVAYGKGPVYAFGLVLMPFIFAMIIGFGKARYRGPQD